MRRSLSAVFDLCLLLVVYITCADPVTAQSTDGSINRGVGGNGNEGSGKTVAVLTNDHEPINLVLSPDGSLSYAEFDQSRNITEGKLQGPPAVSCFFWGPSERSTDFLSPVHTTDTPEIEFQMFGGAERVYCYDRSRDDADRNTFTLFFEMPATEAEETASLSTENHPHGRLIRIRIGEDEEFVELPLCETHPELCVGTKAMLIDWPFPSERFNVPREQDKLQVAAGCKFYIEHRGLGRYFDADTSNNEFIDAVNFPRILVVKRVACFRDIRNKAAEDRFLRLAFPESYEEDS